MSQIRIRIFSIIGTHILVFHLAVIKHIIKKTISQIWYLEILIWMKALQRRLAWALLSFYMLPLLAMLIPFLIFMERVRMHAHHDIQSLLSMILWLHSMRSWWSPQALPSGKIWLELTRERRFLSKFDHYQRRFYFYVSFFDNQDAITQFFKESFVID